jgi:CBS domain-containing protein
LSEEIESVEDLDLRVKDIMTKNPLTVGPDSSVHSAASGMKKCGCGCCLDESRGKIVGIVTERYIVRRVAAKGAAPARVKVKSIMTTKLMAVKPDATVEEAVRIMGENGIRQLPVVGDEGLVGIISVADVARLSFCLTDRHGLVARDGGRGESSRSYIIVPSLVAVPPSVHGFSEGADFGAFASSATGTSLIAVLGGYSPAISSVLHKMLEASMIGASYLHYSSSSNQARGWTDRLRDISILGAVLTIPSLLGMSTGYYLQFVTTSVFALATGTSVYIALRLAQPLTTSGPRNSYSESLKITLLIISGFLSIYFAVSFHSNSLGD